MLWFNLVNFIASAGGGGSSSGGGGGGGGGSSSSSSSDSSSGSGGGGATTADNFWLVTSVFGFAIGYVIGATSEYVAGGKGNKFSRRELCYIAIYWLLSTIIMTFLYVVADNRSAIFAVVIGAISSAISAVLFAWGLDSGGRRIKDAKEARDSKLELEAYMQNAARENPVWNTDYLHNGVMNVFNRYQADWGMLNVERVRPYTTPEYFGHVSLMLEAFRDAGRRNVTTVLQYNSNKSYIQSINKQEMSFIANITAYVKDELIDIRDNRVLISSNYVLNEEWRFRYINGEWLLDGIVPNTADTSTREREIKEFAKANGAYYSLDWGRMLLPSRGQIFDATSFRVADVNNHVIGRLIDTGRAVGDGVVYQIYTYSKRPYHQSRNVYLVGQLAVPKSYGNIVIRRRKKRFLNMPSRISGLTRVTYESSEFNNLYEVFTTKPDQITSFELLHPAMLQTLADAPFEINIEVIDNIIYFYVLLQHTNAQNYASMLAILQAAYRELKM